ncbi:MAG TPA: hypothetical protein PK948_07570 [Gemmatimonadales bacterium]|nr:hypothetical protein [Gemmatimonadales bacterium]
MIRSLALTCGLLLTLAGTSPPSRLPASLAEAGDSARVAWQRRDLAAFLGAAGGGRLLVSLPGGQQSAPITPDQARALLSAYVQGSEEVTTSLNGARTVDSTRGYVELLRRFRLVGIPGERESLILLGYRRGREFWVLTEVRIAS